MLDCPKKRILIYTIVRIKGKYSNFFLKSEMYLRVYLKLQYEYNINKNGISLNFLIFILCDKKAIFYNNKLCAIVQKNMVKTELS